MKNINLIVNIWRQASVKDEGKFVKYELKELNQHMSFLEMMDVLNEGLIKKGELPVSFDHDCREGICGSCSMFINGEAHGPGRNVTTCQLHMRSFKDGETIHVEPWRASAFPVIKDLTVDLKEGNASLKKISEELKKSQHSCAMLKKENVNLQTAVNEYKKIQQLSSSTNTEQLQTINNLQIKKDEMKNQISDKSSRSSY